MINLPSDAMFDEMIIKNEIMESQQLNFQEVRDDQTAPTNHESNKGDDRVSDSPLIIMEQQVRKNRKLNVGGSRDKRNEWLMN